MESSKSNFSIEFSNNIYNSFRGIFLFDQFTVLFLSYNLIANMFCCGIARSIKTLNTGVDERVI